MAYQYIYIAFIVISAVAAVVLYQQSSAARLHTSNIKFRRNMKNIFAKFIDSFLCNDNLDKVFLSSGLNITSVTYNLLRYIVIIVWLLIIFLSYMLNGYINPFQILFLIAVIMITKPVMKFLGQRSPFNYIITIITKEFKHKKNQEIYRAFSQLKNLSIISAHTNIGSDFIIQELMKMTKITKPIFATTLRLWRENERQDAMDYFAAALDTREGSELANIFLKLDDLGPDELREQIALCQNIFSEERRTNKEKRNENRSYVLYAFVITSIFIILFNFVVMIVYINTADVFKTFNFKFY